MPFGIPIPPSPDTSQAILAAFAARGIRFIKDSLVTSLDPQRKVAVLNDGRELPYALFLGVPVHRPPGVVLELGLAVDGWVPVNKQTLETRFPGVYAVGDVNSVGTPKAGVFAEGAAQVAAAGIIARLRGDEMPAPYAGAGSCYVEFGGQQVGRIDVNFLSGPNLRGPSRRNPRRWSPKRCTSAPAGSSAGSGVRGARKLICFSPVTASSASPAASSCGRMARRPPPGVCRINQHPPGCLQC